MIALCRDNPQVSALNEGALSSERLTVVIDDAYRYLEETEEVYDVILVDLPDPNNDALNKLYTNIFYRLCGNHLTQDGVLAVQFTSPYYAKKAYWCVAKTLESEGFFVDSYHLQVPAFGDWGFHMAAKQELSEEYKLSVETKYLSEENIPALFAFGKDEVDPDVQINSLSHPMLIHYYSEAVRNWE